MYIHPNNFSLPLVVQVIGQLLLGFLLVPKKNGLQTPDKKRKRSPGRCPLTNWLAKKFSKKFNKVYLFKK